MAVLNWTTEYLAIEPKTEVTLRVWKAFDGDWHWAAYDPFDGDQISEAYIPWDAEGYETFIEACGVAEKALSDNYAILFETFR